MAEQVFQVQYRSDRMPQNLCSGHVDVAVDRGVVSAVTAHPTSDECEACAFEREMERIGKCILWKP